MSTLSLSDLNFVNTPLSVISDRLYLSRSLTDIPPFFCRQRFSIPKKMKIPFFTFIRNFSFLQFFLSAEPRAFLFLSSFENF